MQTNCYILASGGEAVVIDPGANADQILEILKEKNLTLKYIINTHGHYDHIGASDKLAEATRAAVCIHPQDNNHVKAELKLDEGMDLHLKNLKLKILYTPGHTPGSITILAGDCLFTGDLIFRGSVGRTDLPGGSWENLTKSLRRILSLPDSLIIYPGHGPETSLAEEKESNPFLQSFDFER